MTAVGTSRRRLVDLAVALVDRDLRVTYGGAAFGLLWAPATILVQAAVLSFLFVRVVPLGVEDYPAFVLTGLVGWHLVASAIAAGSDAFTANRDLVRRPGFPDLVLPLVTTGRSLAAYMLGLPAVAVVLLATGRLGVTALALPLVAATGVLVATGPAYLVATLNVAHRDVGHLVRVLLAVLFYLTPVLYALERLPDGYRWLGDVNPIAGVVVLHRQVLYEGAWPGPGRLAATALLGLAVLALGLLVHQRAAGHLADDL